MFERWENWVLARRRDILDQFNTIPSLRQVGNILDRCSRYGKTDLDLWTAGTTSTLAGPILWACRGLHICLDKMIE